MASLNKDEVIRKIKEGNFRFAWVNTFSKLDLRELNDNRSYEVMEEDLDNLIEAKFFNEDIELSIIANEDGDFSVVEFEGRGKNFTEETQRLISGKRVFPGFKNDLVIRNYIEYDDDGQAYICYSKLHNVIKGGVDDERQ